MHHLISLPLLCLITACFTQPLDDPEASDGASSSLSKRIDYGGPRSGTLGWIGQFSTPDCSTFPVVKAKEWQGPACQNEHVDPDTYCIAGARPKLYPGSCIPWYPVLTAEKGPSLGVTFGAGENKLDQIRFFKSAARCVENGPLACCNERLGTLLGVMYQNGTADFGASYNVGLKHGMCAKIGSQPDANQTIWETRYVMAYKNDALGRRF